MARPTNYDESVLEAALEYLEIYQEKGQVVPTVVGLCQHIRRSKATVYNWQKDDDKPEFLDILNEIEERQHLDLVSGGLAGGFNPAVTKMMLTKHGYSDKQEVDHRSGDGSMTPPAPMYKVVDE